MKHQVAAEHGMDDEFQMSDEDLFSSAKLQQLIQILEKQAVDAAKTLVFSQFTQLLDITEAVLARVGIKFCRLDGTTPIEDRQQLASTFQGSGGPAVFLVSTKAGGMGLTLTAANAVVMLDLDFNPQNTRQAEDRVHRLGQTQDVTVYYLVCQGTVEEMVLKRNIAKMELDQKFGAQHAALELAATGPQNILTMPHADDDDDTGTGCEESVLAELSVLLQSGAKREEHANNTDQCGNSALTEYGAEDADEGTHGESVLAELDNLLNAESVPGASCIDDSKNAETKEDGIECQESVLAELSDLLDGEAVSGLRSVQAKAPDVQC